jgi:hypothetical protein
MMEKDWELNFLKRYSLRNDLQFRSLIYRCFPKKATHVRNLWKSLSKKLKFTDGSVPVHFDRYGYGPLIKNILLGLNISLNIPSKECFIIQATFVTTKFSNYCFLRKFEEIEKVQICQNSQTP